MFRVGRKRKKKSIALCELLARLTEVWNEASARVSVKLLNSGPCGILCSYDHWGAGVCFLCLLIRTTTHSLVIGVSVISLRYTSNDWDGWQIVRSAAVSTSLPARASSFTQTNPEMRARAPSFRASMAFKRLRNSHTSSGKSNINKHFISIEAAAEGCVCGGVCTERKALSPPPNPHTPHIFECGRCEIHGGIASVGWWDMRIAHPQRSRRALFTSTQWACGCQNAGWVAGLCSAPRLGGGGVKKKKRRHSSRGTGGLFLKAKYQAIIWRPNYIFVLRSQRFKQKKKKKMIGLLRMAALMFGTFQMSGCAIRARQAVTRCKRWYAA